MSIYEMDNMLNRKMSKIWRKFSLKRKRPYNIENVLMFPINNFILLRGFNTRSLVNDPFWQEKNHVLQTHIHYRSSSILVG